MLPVDKMLHIATGALISLAVATTGGGLAVAVLYSVARM